MASVLFLLWIPAYHNSGGTANSWYTIFVDLDVQFAAGLSQVLFAMSVIEICKPGQEATTYELLISVFNAGLTVSNIIATQILTPLKVTACFGDDDCTSGKVRVAVVVHSHPISYFLFVLLRSIVFIYYIISKAPFIKYSFRAPNHVTT